MSRCIVCRAFDAGVGPEVVLHRSEAFPLCFMHKLEKGRFIAWTRPRIGTPAGDKIVERELLSAARQEVRQNLTAEERTAIAEGAGLSEKDLAWWMHGGQLPKPSERRILDTLRRMAAEAAG